MEEETQESQDIANSEEAGSTETTDSQTIIGDGSFSEALMLLKQGNLVTRQGWSGFFNAILFCKGIYLGLQNPDEHSMNKRPYIYIVPVDGQRVPWVASQTDMLSEDWELFEPTEYSPHLRFAQKNKTEEEETQESQDIANSEETGSMDKSAEPTYGELAVGLSFNPANDPTVQKVKELYAQIIDLCHDEWVIPRLLPDEKGRLFSVAITEAQTAQMWAVRAITWK